MNGDEEIQRKAEELRSGDATPDETMYRLIFNVLEKEPDAKLSSSFTDRVMEAIESRREAVRDRWWLVLGIVGIACALIIALTMIESLSNATFITSGPGGLILFVGFFMTLLHIIDRFVLRKPAVE